MIELNPPLLAYALAVVLLLAALRLLWLRPSRWPLRLLLSAAAAAALYAVLQPPEQPLPRAGALTVLAADWSHADAALGPIEAVVALPEAADPLPVGAVRVPDLASALRLQPQFDGLRLLGLGLPARDVDAARGRLVQFVAAPLPDGLQALHYDPSLALGADIEISGHWQGPPPERLQLLDSEGALLAEQVMGSVAAAGAGDDDAAIGASSAATAPSTAAPDLAAVETARSPEAATRVNHRHAFALRTPARAAGEIVVSLAAVDAAGAKQTVLELPIRVREPRALRVQLRAGAPGPELLRLRRWAVDAGLILDSRIQFAPGLVQSGLIQSGVVQSGVVQGRQAAARPISDPRPTAVDAAELAALDLLILDERAWAALGPAGRATVLAAVDEGLGLLLRLSALPAPAQRSELAELGFAITPREVTPALRLPDSALRLRRLPIEVQAEDAVALPITPANEPAGLWRARGQGRIGLLWLLDSFRLVGAGEAAQHAALWAQISGVLSRPPAPHAERDALTRPLYGWRGERLSVCGPGADLALRSPAGDRTVLASTKAAIQLGAQAANTAEIQAGNRAENGAEIPAAAAAGTRAAAAVEVQAAVKADALAGDVLDPQTEASGEDCRAAWPAIAGLHRIEQPQAADLALPVLEPAALPALHAAERAAATRLLAAQALAPAETSETLSAPGSPWPWLGLLLALLALLWWLERPRPGA